MVDTQASNRDATTPGLAHSDLALPGGWPAVEDDVFEIAMTQARRALGLASWSTPSDDGHEPGERTANSGWDVESALRGYFDPAGGYSGTLFSNVGSDLAATDTFVPADLLAVTTLSMKLNVSVVRQVVEPGEKRNRLLRLLAAVPADVPLHELGRGDTDASKILEALEEVYRELRSTPNSNANKWVFASKLLARKRPQLMPVRDNVVCKFLAASTQLRKGHVGTFRVDMQIFAHLMSDQSVRIRLTDLHRDLERQHGAGMESVTLLRLLDVALWCAGTADGYNA